MPTAQMDTGARGWIVKTIRENYWRVADYYEFDDLVQDSYLVWKKIVDRYPDVTEPKHRMALFKTAFRNHIHDVSKKRTLYVERYTLEADMPVSMETLREGDDGSQDPNAGLIVSQLPDKLKNMLARLCTEKRNYPYRRYLDGTRETFNERLCRLAGLDPDLRNVPLAIQTYLHGSRLHPQYD